MMHYAGHTQKQETKVWLPRIDAVNGLVAIKQSRIKDSVISHMQSDAANYEVAINGLQMALTAYSGKDSMIAASYQREIAVMQSQRGDLEARIKVLERQVRRAQRGKTVTAIVGLLGIVATGVLLLR